MNTETISNNVNTKVMVIPNDKEDIVLMECGADKGGSCLEKLLDMCDAMQEAMN